MSLLTNICSLLTSVYLLKFFYYKKPLYRLRYLGTLIYYKQLHVVITNLEVL